MKPPVKHSRVILPAHPFFYTLDQVAILLSQSDSWLHARVFYLGRTGGKKTPAHLEAINMAEASQPANWRVDERELIRWLSRHGYAVERRSY